MQSESYLEILRGDLDSIAFIPFVAGLPMGSTELSTRPKIDKCFDLGLGATRHWATVLLGKNLNPRYHLFGESLFAWTRLRVSTCTVT
jgi:hypothetical protein